MKFSNLETQNKILLVSFVVFLGLYILLTYRQKPSEPAKETTTQVETADTYIPAGHVLVPIEIENVDSVSGIIGAFALVDLYTRPPNSASPEMLLVAQKIKLIRAPLNPNQYAVLVTDAESTELLKSHPRFWVTIHNQKSKAAPAPKSLVKIAVPIQEDAEPLKKVMSKIKRQRASIKEDILIEYYQSKKARYL